MAWLRGCRHGISWRLSAWHGLEAVGMHGLEVVGISWLLEVVGMSWLGGCWHCLAWRRLLALLGCCRHGMAHRLSPWHDLEAVGMA